ncbi:MAG: response regulator [Enterocloster bolteae]
MEADDELCDRTDAQDSRNIFKGRRFLLVEDNELNCEIASQLLEVSGAAVECAPNGAEGAKAFEEKEPGYYDAIFMDIQMPVMNGYEAARHIRQIHSSAGRQYSDNSHVRQHIFGRCACGAGIRYECTCGQAH